MIVRRLNLWEWKNMIVMFLVFELIESVIMQDCDYIPYCRRCDYGGCLQCLKGYKVNANGTCSVNTNSYRVLIIVASVLLGIMSLLACGWIIYGQILRYRRRQQVIVIRQQLQGFYRNQANHGTTAELQLPQTNRVMLPSTPTLSFLNTETCTICLDGNIQIRSSCQHYFHLACILNWTVKSTQCPNCRAKSPLYMTLCHTCKSFNQIVQLCGPRCKQSDHTQCFYQINCNVLNCKLCKSRA